MQFNRTTQKQEEYESECSSISQGGKAGKAWVGHLLLFPIQSSTLVKLLRFFFFDKLKLLRFEQTKRAKTGMTLWLVGFVEGKI